MKSLENPQVPKPGKNRASKAKKDDKIYCMIPTPSSAAGYYLDYCSTILSVKNLERACEVFEEQKNRLHEEHKKFIGKISKEPFVASFIIWIKDFGSLRENTLKAATSLLNHDLIRIVDEEGKPWTIAKARNFDHRTILESIRSHREWSLKDRENLVQTYLAFMLWLSAETHGYINRLEDPDYHRSQGRALAYPLFITFLDALTSDNAQLVAKLLYFGGSRTMDEILQLKIEDVDFPKQLMYFNSQPVSYPAHVFTEIDALTHPRKKGKVFLGRQKAPLNPATIFRNFKEAALKVNLGSSFTPANLTTNT